MRVWVWVVGDWGREREGLERLGGRVWGMGIVEVDGLKGCGV